MTFDRVARRNDVSEQEIETMLKDLGQELVEAKPVNLNKLGIDEIAVVSKKLENKEGFNDEFCLVPINGI